MPYREFFDMEKFFKKEQKWIRDDIKEKKKKGEKIDPTDYSLFDFLEYLEKKGVFDENK